MKKACQEDNLPSEQPNKKVVHDDMYKQEFICNSKYYLSYLCRPKQIINMNPFSVRNPLNRVRV